MSKHNRSSPAADSPAPPIYSNKRVRSNSTAPTARTAPTAPQDPNALELAIKRHIWAKASTVRAMRSVASFREYYGLEAWARLATKLIALKTQIADNESMIAENEGNSPFKQHAVQKQGNARMRCAEEVFKLFPDQPKEQIIAIANNEFDAEDLTKLNIGFRHVDSLNSLVIS